MCQKNIYELKQIQVGKKTHSKFNNHLETLKCMTHKTIFVFQTCFE